VTRRPALDGDAIRHLLLARGVVIDESEAVRISSTVGPVQATVRSMAVALGPGEPTEIGRFRELLRREARA
jgi:hypothetical protein